MTIYYASTSARQFFFTTDHIQCERQGQNISNDFVPVTDYAHTNQDVREYFLADGYTEIDNPDPSYVPIAISGLLMGPANLCL